MIVADDLAPNKHCTISNHHADMAVITVISIVRYVFTPLQSFSKQCLREVGGGRSRARHFLYYGRIRFLAPVRTLEKWT